MDSRKLNSRIAKKRYSNMKPGQKPEILQKIALPSGRKMAVHESGPEGALSCLFIHGFGEGAFVWSSIADYLSPSFHCIAVDLCGHGDSDWQQDSSYSLSQHVADIVDLIDALHLESFVLIGHSLGAAVSLEVSSRLEKKLGGLALIDYSPEPNSEARSAVNKDFAENVRRTFSSVFDYEQTLLRKRPLIDPAEAARIAVVALRRDNDGHLRLKADPKLALTGRNPVGRSAIDHWELLSQITHPTLIVRGQASAILTKKDAEKMVERLSNGLLETINGAGHAVMSDQPEATRHVLLKFVNIVMAEVN